MTLLLNFFIRYVVLWLRDFVWKVAENQGDQILATCAILNGLI